MTQRLLIIAATLALGAAATPTSAVERVTGSVGPTVRTYTEHGDPDGEVPSAKLKLPTTGTDVVGRNSKGYPGILVDGKLVYLRSSDVNVKDNSERPVCVEFAVVGKKAGSALAGTGVRHGAAETEVPCIPAAGKK